MKAAGSDSLPRPAALGLPSLPVVLALAALAGAFVAISGGVAGTRAIYYSAVLGAIGVGGGIALTRREPARFAFLALIAALPFADVPIPPARLGIRIFDVVMLPLAITLIVRRMLAWPADRGRLFPAPVFAVAWLMFGACIALSLYPVASLLSLVIGLAVYTFFLFALDELRREGGFERLAALWTSALLLLSLGLLVDYFFRVNLSLRGGNLNQLSWAMGQEIWRAGGFFQDPQKAGAFLASMIPFLVVLAARGRFANPKLRYFVWASIVLGAAAIVTSIARGAIVACLVVSVFALFAFNRWHSGLKLLAAAAAIAAALCAVIVPGDVWLDLLPDAVAARLAHLGEDFQNRLMIWFDTWEMFAEHPLAGVGPGGFQTYLIETRPGITGYYGIGVAQGAHYVPEQPESGYLKILYESGIIGAFAALLLIGDTLRRAFAVLRRAPAGSPVRSEVVAALAGLATFAVTFSTLFTLGDPRVAALLMFLLAVIWRHSLAEGPQLARRGRA